MTSAFKIRLLLFILTIGFAATAISVHFNFDKGQILESDARTIEQNLQKKERFVKSFLNNKANFKALQSIHKNPARAAELIKDFRDKRSIYLHTYYNEQLVFWGANRIVPTTDAGLKEGSNRLKTRNGWYEAIRKSEGPFSVVCIIPIKAEYPFQNRYLKNSFAPDLIEENNLDIAGLNDKKVYNIKNSEGHFILSVKLKSSVINSFYSKLELWMIALTVLFMTIFVNQVSTFMASRGHIKSAIGLFALYFLILKIASVEFPVFSSYFNLSLFDPRHYSGGYFFRSLGDFLLTTIAMSWLLCFFYSYRKKITLASHPIPDKAGAVIFIALGVVIYAIANQQSDIFYQLIVNSNINFNLTNILYLDIYSWIGILLMCIGAFNLYLLLEIFLALGAGLPLSNNQKLKIFLISIGVILLAQAISGTFAVYTLLFSIIVFIKGWAFYTDNKAYNYLIFVLVVLLFSIIASIKLSSFQYIKERDHRQVIAYRLESADDPNAVLLFFSLEQEILKDNFVKEYFKAGSKDRSSLKDKLRKLYFDGYLSRYEFDVHTYFPGQESTSPDSAEIRIFRNFVLAGSIKVSENFYRINNTFGYQHYFAIIPVREGEQVLGTLLLTLKSATVKNPREVPEVLVDNKMYVDKDLQNYSFAFYLNGLLLNQNGTYIYNLVNNDFKGKDNSFVFMEKNGYNHLIYKPNSKKVIVVSQPVTTWIMKLGSVSFLFLVMIVLSVVILGIHQVWLVIHDENFKLTAHKLAHIFSRKRILYSTRIQASLVSAIILTLLIVGVITYISISRQFRQQLQEDAVKQIDQITTGIEKNQIFKEGSLADNEDALHSFADINATDLNLFDLQGKLIYTTQNKIYENGFVEPKMNAFAYIFLNKFQRSEFINTEQVGRMKFISAYKPLRNSRNETIAYLSLPYFSNETDYDQRIGQYLNTIINVYALVLVAITLFAIFLANQITYPLILVSKSLSEIRIGSRNEPIRWNSNDEIGTLIKEYNNMITALEESARKLARSERESAWREMAKQVAHEIKNPLTPLKLGVQLLEKSWREKDPNFDKKFAKFSRSFIEQIESLALIASEFSNFAKLPDAPLENIDLIEVIEKSVDSFRLNGHTIPFEFTEKPLIVNGSKDHLLRIFNNLVQNAIEAIPEEREKKIVIRLYPQNRQVHIEVEDNGNGISEELREKIFNANFTTKTSGTGLGLAFVKQAVENMLGSIHFTTEPGKGTIFHIDLPLTS
ncbi:sensor histidine kinase [Pararcticibacter amylolyticus]|uniref:histidine kinase n=1 Tax=Pararcticibacter amylolyticus TaxID=2173175 RepID=A0A2U2PME4_9SPHI|nr:ATP-binding protein [Pararcticibacter amylolyticus]PWG82573.1 two-component sensor histidine kinase [Pararcticibacter amylolyticus]